MKFCITRRGSMIASTLCSTLLVIAFHALGHRFDLPEVLYDIDNTNQLDLDWTPMALTLRCFISSSFPTSSVYFFFHISFLFFFNPWPPPVYNGDNGRLAGILASDQTNPCKSVSDYDRTFLLRFPPHTWIHMDTRHKTHDKRHTTQDTKQSKPCKSVSDYNRTFFTSIFSTNVIHRSI